MPTAVKTSTIQIPVFIDIDLSKCLRIYSGRQGCACGCRGKYFETELGHKLATPGERKYRNDPAPRSVKTLLGKFERAIAAHPTKVCTDFHTPGGEVEFYVSVDLPGYRVYTAYFTKKDVK